jgi:hypothetical protein
MFHRQLGQDRGDSGNADVTADYADNADAVEAGVPSAEVAKCG